MEAGNFTGRSDNETSHAVLALFAARFPRRAEAQPSCDDAQLSGEYGGYAWGTCPGNHLCNSDQTWYFDGNGDYTMETAGMLGGSFTSSSHSGTYNVFSDPNTGACRVFYSVPGQTNTDEFTEGQGFTFLYQLDETAGANSSGVTQQ